MWWGSEARISLEVSRQHTALQVKTETYVDVVGDAGLDHLLHVLGVAAHGLFDQHVLSVGEKGTRRGCLRLGRGFKIEIKIEIEIEIEIEQTSRTTTHTHIHTPTYLPRGRRLEHPLLA